ncbi:MAG TPA: cytochrome c [Rhodanobacter sp.]|nr:cytochrome c [Rhodanobacter sp.]
MHKRQAIGVLLVAVCVLAVAGCRHDATVDSAGTLATPDPTTSAALVARGHYLVQAGDCEFCHTRAGGQPFAGGRAVPTPFGKIFSVNITPDNDTGIGHWSKQDFYKAMHEGISKDGSHLYPAFPYPWFTKVTRADVDAIYAYLATVKPVKQDDTPNQLPWYLSWRGALAGWNLLYFDEGTYQDDPNHSAAWNRGAYLAQGLAHCSACHTPVNMLGGSKHDKAYQGGNAGLHWMAPGLDSNLRDGVGGWSSAEIVEYLQTGSNAKSATAGPMTDVVMNSTQYLTREDLAAIAVFLKDRPQQASKSPPKTASLGAARLARGQALYIDNCTACHMPDGRGMAKVFPPLTGSAAIQADNPGTVIHVVLEGARMAAPSAKPTGLAMPGFGWKLDDRQVADVVNYIRHAWGNRAPLVDADAVAAVRKDIAAEYRPSRDKVTKHPDRPARHGSE